MRRTWSRAKIIARIQQLPQQNSAYAQKEYNPLWKAAVRYFGSWKAAVEAAGFDYAAVRRYGPWAPANKGTRGRCSTPGCDRPHHARGWCKRCYNKRKRAGDL